MNRARQVMLCGALGLVLLLRWWDPLAHRQDSEIAPVSAPVIRSPQATIASPIAVDPNDAYRWPLQKDSTAQTNGNLFASRSEHLTQQAMAKMPPPPLPPVYVPPPPPPPPVEQPPAVQVIGTWGTAPDLSVFVSVPQGTLLVKKGDAVMSEYKVQNITKQLLTLVNQGTQKTWQIAIPDAPSVLKTWPGR
jgi:hypothetical protein